MNSVELKKIVLGFRPETKNFRISSLGGLVVDAVLASRGKNIPDKYYDIVATSQNHEYFQLRSEDKTNQLSIDLENITFQKNMYGLDSAIDVERVLNEFEKIIPLVDEALGLNNIRRIGIYAEYRTKETDPDINKKILGSITKLNNDNYPAKFGIRYEKRYPTLEMIAPDINKDDFYNVIYHIYDSNRDVDYPEDNKLNINIDVQKYFAPPVDKGFNKEISTLQKRFNAEKNKFLEQLSVLGV